MNVRKSVAALVAAGALVSGIGTAAAFADTPTAGSPAATAPAKAKSCAKAADRAQKLRADLSKLDGRLVSLAQDRAKAVAAHKDARVKKIDGRADTVHTHHVSLEARIDAIAKACPSS